MMTRKIKFTLGGAAYGYKTVALTIDGDTASYEILRGGLLDVGRKTSLDVKVSAAWLAELDALNIFAWEADYSSKAGGVLWSLTFEDGEKIYRGRGASAFPEEWSRFLDWLDALIPELQFVNRRRLERVNFDYCGERLTLDRRAGTLTLEKKNSAHSYRLGANKRKFFDACQKLIDGAERDDTDSSANPDANSSANSNADLRVAVETLLHDGTSETFETLYNENFLPGLTRFLEELQNFASDLTAKIFSPALSEGATNQGKLILCKVQFKGSYKHYTYRTDDETLAVGDVVDVPVGKYNDTNHARIVDIGYFEEYEAPFALDKIKKIIGRHIAADWEDL